MGLVIPIKTGDSGLFGIGTVKNKSNSCGTLEPGDTLYVYWPNFTLIPIGKCAEEVYRG